MDAKLIRTEKTEWGATQYFFECSECGGEYFKWKYNKRTSNICSKCCDKRQQKLTKIREQRKQQECIDDVLRKISAELQRMADDEWNKQVGSSKGLEDAIDVINGYIGDKT